jgi:flavin reductase (DIM6/NTAB) family NADH-FMN oxidoreductase RutF
MTGDHMSVDSDDFRKAMAQFATGVTVVTTRDSSRHLLGLTANAFCSVSLTPPLVLVCVGAHSETHPGFVQSGYFGVSVLAENQEVISRSFAQSGLEKFEGAPLVEGRHGLPLLEGALAHMECRVVAAHPAGDHTIYLGEVLRMEVFAGRPLLYYRSSYHRLEAEEDAQP